MFCGFGGDDLLSSLEEGDIFLGGPGNDFVGDVNGTFYGEEGNDSVHRNESTGTFNGGAGNDRVLQNFDFGTFNGGPGDDSVDSGNPPEDGP